MLLIPVDGSDCKVVRPDGWQEMAALVGGGLVERVRVAEDAALAVDEEGRFRPEPRVNERASLLYGIHRHGVPIVGDALFGVEGMVGEGVEMGVGWVDTDADDLFGRVHRLLQAARAEMGR